MKSAWCLWDPLLDVPLSRPEPSSPGEGDPRCLPCTPAELAGVCVSPGAWPSAIIDCEPHTLRRLCLRAVTIHRAGGRGTTGASWSSWGYEEPRFKNHPENHHPLSSACCLAPGGVCRRPTASSFVLAEERPGSPLLARRNAGGWLPTPGKPDDGPFLSWDWRLAVSRWGRRHSPRTEWGRWRAASVFTTFCGHYRKRHLGCTQVAVGSQV